MKTLILLFSIMVLTSLGAQFGQGMFQTVSQYSLFITAGISFLVLTTGMTD